MNEYDQWNYNISDIKGISKGTFKKTVMFQIPKFEVYYFED